MATDVKTLYYHTAIWCPPCKALKPKVKALCEEHGIAFEEIDVDDPTKKPKVDDILGLPVIVIESSEGIGYDILRAQQARIPNIKKALGL